MCASGRPNRIAAAHEERLHGYDLILTSFPHFVDRFRALGLDGEYLRLASSRGCSTGSGRRLDRPRTFVGSVDPRVHPEGVILLERVAPELPIEAFGYGAGEPPPASPLAPRTAARHGGSDMYPRLAELRVTLNRHIGTAEGFANNMRLYEATGVGALLLTEAAPNLAGIFEPGVEIVTYTDADELVEKARHYLEHDDERAAIAAAGQARTLREHTYEQRTRELVVLLEARRPS